jgi:hypothetical protein
MYAAATIGDAMADLSIASCSGSLVMCKEPNTPLQAKVGGHIRFVLRGGGLMKSTEKTYSCSNPPGKSQIIARFLKEMTLLMKELGV